MSDDSIDISAQWAAFTEEPHPLSSRPSSQPLSPHEQQWASFVADVAVPVLTSESDPTSSSTEPRPSSLEDEYRPTPLPQPVPTGGGSSDEGDGDGQHVIGEFMVKATEAHS